MTPGKGSDILLGITRDSLIKVAESLGIKTDERMVHKEELYTADELFFAGTAAEMTPISEVDGIMIGDGNGRITKLLWNKFSDIIHGRDKQFEDWLTPV